LLGQHPFWSWQHPFVPKPTESTRRRVAVTRQCHALLKTISVHEPFDEAIKLSQLKTLTCTAARIQTVFSTNHEIHKQAQQIKSIEKREGKRDEETQNQNQIPNTKYQISNHYA
jgi:hypothetical protein